MKFLGFAFLAVLAVALVLGILLGAAIQLVWYGFLALLVVGAVTFVMKKIRKPVNASPVDYVDAANRDAERLPR
jgi:hypothetical protein